MTAMWVLMSASGALLAAKQGRDPHSTDGPGSGKWERCGGVPGETLRWEHKGDQAALTYTLCESSTGLGCVVSLGEQSRALCALGTPGHCPQNFPMWQPESKQSLEVVPVRGRGLEQDDL